MIILDQVGKDYRKASSEKKSAQIGRLIKGIMSGGEFGEQVGDTYTALSDVTFSVRRGEALGVVGRNGAGKSTLMKVIAGLLAPDRGEVKVNGRVLAMINLSAGFDAELSGRENISLVAAMHGFDMAAIAKIENEVIDFAELGDFIDEPISTYSSGMAARLGFSVCIHLSPEILIIDEALSVGDGRFQNKCLLRLEKLRAEGLTMILVSHGLTQILQFCSRAIWLDRGEVRMDDTAKAVTQAYSKWMLEGSAEETIGAKPNVAVKAKALDGDTPVVAPREDARPVVYDDIARPYGQKIIAFNEGRFSKIPFAPAIPASLPEDIAGAAAAHLYGELYDTVSGVEDVKISLRNPTREDGRLYCHEPLVIDYEFSVTDRTVTDLNVSLHIYDEAGKSVTTLTTLQSDALKKKSSGRVCVRLEIDDFCLAPGRYVIVMPIHEGRAYLSRGAVATISVQSDVYPVYGQVNFQCRCAVL